MAIQFRCPCEQAKLLEADESLVGQAIQCPYCEMQFLVPAPAPVAPAQQPRGTRSSAGGTGQSLPKHGGSSRSSAAWEGSPRQAGTLPEAPSAPAITTGTPQLLPGEMPGVVHLACPSGHELEVPRELLGTDIACPVCGVEFRLRREDTDEYRAEKHAERERKEQQFGRKMMNFSIVVAVLVVLAILIMALYIGLA
ncbi:MAG: hypothetical protein K2Y37_07800 [Pirellulales bacterium]|nr:hypothetical protein [Pirellulales bacterium]